MRTPPDKRRNIEHEDADAQLPNRSWLSRPQKNTVLIIAVAICLGILVASNLVMNRDTKKEEKITPHADTGGPRFRRTEAAEPEPKMTFAAMPNMRPLDDTPPSTGQSRRPSTGTLFAFTSGDNPDATYAPPGKPGAGNHDENGQMMAGDDDPLSNQLRASNTGKTAKAHVLKHPRLTVPRGTGIPCLLKTRIDTSRPGIVVCDSKEEVRGWGGGAVMLLPRWTRFTGQISRGLTVDQERVDVLWTSVLTPDSIEIAINSPATDMLGSAGLDGQVENHIPEKIGAVLLYTAIEAGPALAVQAVQNQSQTGSVSPYSYNSVYQPSQNVAGDLLRQKLQRPPILVKNQGEEVMVMVAQNWDLSDVIDLKPVR